MKFPKIDIWLGSEYVSSSKYASFTQGSVENAPSYMFDRVLSIPQCARASVVNFARLRRVLFKLCFKGLWYLECLEFWICYGFECIRSLNILQLQRIWRKYFIAYIPEFISRTLHWRCLAGFWIFLGFWVYQDSKYARFT